MSKLKVFCFGFGQVAESFINKLIIEKKDFDLSITSRQETHQIELNNLKITSFFFNNDQFDESVFNNLGYHCYWHSAVKKGYSGVGILTKRTPLHVEYGTGIS